MCNDNIIIPITIVDNYINYRKAISTGLSNTAKDYKLKFIDGIFLKMFNNCNKCNSLIQCANCDTITVRCLPSIVEYNKIKTCIKNKCITIVEI